MFEISGTTRCAMGEDQLAKLDEIIELMKTLRWILKVPEEKSMIDHAATIMRKYETLTQEKSQ